MQQKIKSRLEELQAEYQKGQTRLAQLEQETAQVKQSMLRISGAIQVLEELIPADGEKEPEVASSENGLTEKSG